jgi:hypothetical protein
MTPYFLGGLNTMVRMIRKITKPSWYKEIHGFTMSLGVIDTNKL